MADGGAHRVAAGAPKRAKKAHKTVGTKAEVYRGMATHTKDKLFRADLVRVRRKIKSGKNKGKLIHRIVSQWSVRRTA